MSFEPIHSDLGPKLCTIRDGMPQMSHHSDESFREAINWVPPAPNGRKLPCGPPQTRFVVTYPKSGTTWTQMIIHLLLNDGYPDKRITWLGGLCDEQPFLERDGLRRLTSVDLSRPIPIKTHLPLNYTPIPPFETRFSVNPQKAMNEGNVRFLHVVRNPKDCVISFYHHYLRRGKLEHIPTTTTTGYDSAQRERALFNFFFEQFLSGTLGHGDWFHTVVSWWMYSKEKGNEDRVHHLTYEDMKRDPARAIKKIAAFLGDDYRKQLELDSNLLNRVLEYSDFKFMAQIPDKEPPSIQILADPCGQIPDKYKDMKFVRKGLVGDWRSFLTNEQNEALNRKFHSYSARFGIDAIWSSLDWLN